MSSWGISFVTVCRRVSLCACFKIAFVDAELFPIDLMYTYLYLLSFLKDKME